MKKMPRILAALMCLVLMLGVFTGCTFTINIDLIDGAPVATEPTTAATTAAPATTAPVAQPETQAPATTAPADTTAAPAGSDSADTTAAPETQAPATTAAAQSANPSTPEEILNVYKEVYKNTKADGSFKGTSNMTCTSCKINGNENGVVKKIADGALAGTTTDQQLCPESEENPYKECDATVDDITNATWTDNGDGTATIVITPKETLDGKKFTSPTGKFFCVMEDVASAIANVSVVTWSEGDANSNTHLTTSGTVTVTYDTATMKMTKGTYDLITIAKADHLNVLMFKNQSAELAFDYVVEFPG